MFFNGERHPMRHHKNETIVYGSQGVFIIADIVEKEDYTGTLREYYVLEGAGGKDTTIFAPTDNEIVLSKMHQILSADEIHKLINNMPQEKGLWIADDVERKEQYHKILASGDRRQLIQVIKALYLQQQAQQKIGRRLRYDDEDFMSKAEKHLYEEFAWVLDIAPDQVIPLITQQIKLQAK
jgi:CarD family transcriptional regulator